MKEIWKDINGFEKLYQISNLGRVKNKKTNRIRKNILWNRYLTITLTKNGKSYLKKVHRLVAEAFCPNPNKYNIVNHIDNNHQNNIYTNLEWCSQKENVNHTKNLIYGENSNTKDLYIEKEKRKRKNGIVDYYRVMIRRNDLSITKGFKNYDDAVRYRDSHLKEWLL